MCAHEVMEDEARYGAMQIAEMIRLLNEGFPLVFNASLRRFDIEDSEFDMITHRTYGKDPFLLPTLHLGAVFGRTDLMQQGLLFQRVNHVYNGFTALDWAVRLNQMESIKFLLNGSFFRDSVRNYSPPQQLVPTLFHAVANPDILRIFLNDSKFDVNKQDDRGMTVFLQACQTGRVTAAEMLLSLPLERNVDRFAAVGALTASYYACHNGYLSMVKLLIKYDCFRCIETGESNVMNHLSPIAAAFQAGHRNVMNYVLSRNFLSDSEIVQCIKVCLPHSQHSAVCVRIALTHMKDVRGHADQLFKLLPVAVYCSKSQAVEQIIAKLMTFACHTLFYKFMSVVDKQLPLSK